MHLSINEQNYIDYMNNIILIHIIKKLSPNRNRAAIIVFVPFPCIVLLDVGCEHVVPSPWEAGLNYEN